ncbi:TadE/TadG family type IV pilus assembly protein [Methylobacterium radiodurans]|uniref:TadE/TadG family type IV pilus assembly protein n=1 Tax=Methylobacterium radiodurans TaxID=2202828 RepID=UPI001FE7FFC4|nr:TadE/TadG family type IV pilus assembly protein [Methylobacterium radiodurans]
MRREPVARRFARARSGASAVEFAIIVPVLLGLFMAAVELPRAFSVAKRLDLAASTMADLISGTNPAVGEVYAAARAVATPYDIEAAGIVLTAAGVYLTDGVAVARVCSSAAQKDQARTVGSVIGPAPTGSAAGTRYVMAEVKMRYAALFRVFPTLSNWTFSYTTLWPVREGKAYWGNPEVVLPGGQPCPPV